NFGRRLLIGNWRIAHLGCAGLVLALRFQGGQQGGGTAESTHKLWVTQVGAGHGPAICAMTTRARLAVFHRACRRRQHRPPPGLINILERPDGRDQQAQRRNQPDRAHAQQHNVHGQIPERASYACHRMASSARKRRILKYIAGMMMMIRTTAMAAARPVLKLVYCSWYIRLAITSVP